MEERVLNISGKKTEYLGWNEHQDADIHLQGETVKRVTTFTYLVIYVGGGWRTGCGSHPQSVEWVEEPEESVWSFL